ncbi:MAG: hypothetical protein R2831_09045 [Chitinophagaceae bacterium]
MTFQSQGIDKRKKRYKKRKAKTTTTQKSTVQQGTIKTYQPNTMNTLALCQELGLPKWYLAIVKGFVFPNNFQAPSSYRLTTFNQSQMDEYLKSIPFEDSLSKNIILPVYLNRMIPCKTFAIHRVQTMDQALQDKYPNIMSFAGQEVGNPYNTIRIDCDGTQTKFMITYDGEVSYIHPYVFQGKTYYACYSKNDPNFSKDNFEK